MIIDKNDGTIANVRLTAEEAKALKLAIKHSRLVIRLIKHECPNVSLEHLADTLHKITQGQTQ